MKPLCAHHRERGSGMIEVLVAIILLSVGMLAMLWTQSKAIEYERTAEFRNNAMQFAVEYADRIRANAGARDSYVFREDYRPRAPIADAARNCLTEVCQPAEMAAYDIVHMRRLVRNTLPAGDIFIEELGKRRMNIWVVWQQPEQAALDDDRISYASLCPSSLNPERGVKPHCVPLGVYL